MTKTIEEINEEKKGLEQKIIVLEKEKKELEQKNKDIEIKVNNANNELSHAVNLKRKNNLKIKNI